MTSDSDVGLPSAASMLVQLLTVDAEMQILRALVKPTGFHYSAFSSIFQYFFIFPFSSSFISFTFSSSSRSFTYIFFFRMPALILRYFAGRFFSSSLRQAKL